jgi:hypothetical protein
MKLAATIFVALHGLGHIVWFFSTWTPRALGEEGRAQLEAHRKDLLVQPGAMGGKMIGLLSLLVMFGFGATAWGIWTEASWWPALLIGSAIASLIVILSMWNPIKPPGPVSISVRALLADIGLTMATLLPWGDKLIAH